MCKISLDLDLKNTWTTLLDSDWFYDMLELDLKSTQTTLLDLNWFYDILDLDLRNTWTNLLNSDLFYYNQAEMLSQKYENLLELPIKQLVIQSILASSVSLGQTMCGVWKTKMLMLFIAKLGIFRIQQELSKSKSNLIPFKR